MALWAAKAARNGNEVATSGKGGGNNGNVARGDGRIRAAAPRAVVG